jgi:hypothetical protein
MQLYLRKALMTGRLPPTCNMLKRNGVWEESLIVEPIKLSAADREFINYREVLYKQLMESLAIPRYSDPFAQAVYESKLRYPKTPKELTKEDYEKSAKIVREFIKRKGKL